MGTDDRPGGYGTAQVSSLLGLPAGRVRSWARRGILRPERDAAGRYRFGFSDLVLLRAARRLLDAGVSARRLGRALERLRDQLPEGREPSAVRIALDGEEIVVQDAGARWEAESGQELLDLGDGALRKDDGARSVTSLAPRRRDPEAGAEGTERGADGWFELGRELEASAAGEAMAAYRRALELAPEHPDAHLNLGRLLHEAREVSAAEAHYRAALAARPDDATAAFNLGVALEDQERPREAAAAYRRAIDADPEAADAHYNLAGMLRRLGREAEALRHLKAYRALVEG